MWTLINNVGYLASANWRASAQRGVEEWWLPRPSQDLVTLVVDLVTLT